MGADYVLEKLPDVSGPGLVEAGRYTCEKLPDVSGPGLVEAGRYTCNRHLCLEQLKDRTVKSSAMSLVL